MAQGHLVNVRLPADLHTEVKAVCAEREVTMRDFFIRSIEYYLEKEFELEVTRKTGLP